MSTFYIANLLEKLPQIPTTRMVHNAICLWMTWDGELDPGVPTMLEEYGGLRMADAYGQANPDSAQAEGVSARYGERTNVRVFDGDVARVTEMDALVAYLQILGKLTDAAQTAAKE